MNTTDSDALDQTDIRRLAAGDASALDALMDRHATPVFHFLVRLLGQEDDANDLAQETFLRVFRACATFKPDHNFRAWLFTIAANLARNRRRWRARHPNVSLDAPAEATDQSLADTLADSTPTPHQAVDVAERHAAVRRAVYGLPEDLRDAIVLCEWEDLPVAQAAALLATTPKAIESRLYRARAILRRALAKWDGHLRSA